MRPVGPKTSLTTTPPPPPGSKTPLSSTAKTAKSTRTEKTDATEPTTSTGLVGPRIKAEDVGPTPTSQAHITQTSQSIPAWATADYFKGVATTAKAKTPSTPAAGNALSLRLGAVGKPTTDVDTASHRQTGRSLLGRVAQHAQVISGVPLSKADIAALGTTVHLTRAQSVEPILEQGLRPTSNPLANWSTWCRQAVYMFPTPPAKGSLEDTIVKRQGMTEVIEIDLTKLDPDKLFRRLMDGAIVYLSNTPIPTDAIAHRGHLADAQDAR